jgi:hypothetical protein
MWASFTTPAGPGTEQARARLAAMAFKVHFSGHSQAREFGDYDGFEFLEGGVLAIHFGDEEQWAEFHPPAKWDQVTADPDHLAGLNTPYVDDDEDDYNDDFDDEEYEDEDYEDDYDGEDDEPEPSSDSDWPVNGS